MDELALDCPVLAGGDGNSTAADIDRSTDRKVAHDRWLVAALKSQWVDCWRELHSNEADYSYEYDRQGAQGASRLDFYLITKNIVNTLWSCNITKSPGSWPVDATILARLPQCKVTPRPQLKKAAWQTIAQMSPPKHATVGDPWTRAKAAMGELAAAIRREGGGTPHSQEAKPPVDNIRKKFWRSAHEGFMSRIWTRPAVSARHLCCSSDARTVRWNGTRKTYYKG